ncbi:tripartite tricarboxylate transporter substrate binding protein [Polaromonas sp.]|uniref:Bug family tripartite tricarboxylate transporter substrate binding protein n=1 Tax=Polaromonas sp. TaxID=1869339 RepID=UPI002488871F|nr:tripartite tricarboxylate transporter substrate binding protein [Polaromonas sp.]MDI1273488.1 tripartite tricarboxylate transporter substrate binding protein [Polaromonas sp.]
MSSTPSRRRLLALPLLALCAAALPSLSIAQAVWPARPIRIVVAYPPGGLSDNIARALGDKLAAQLGTPVLVENRAGAGGSIGMDVVAKAAPDGYTIGFSSISPLALNPHLGKLPYDPARDIAPVASVMYSPVVLLATSAFAGKNFKDMLAAAKASPGSIRWSTSGLATVGHIVLEQVQQGAKAGFTHIPYKGGGQQLTDALSGQFEVITTNLSSAVMPHIQSGKLRPLAVGAPARVEALPQVPTFAELGFAPANLSSLFGVFAPGKTPEAVLLRLNTEINLALKTPELRQRLLAADNVPTGGSAAEFSRQIAQESDNNARIIKAAQIKGD